jgi:AcrR family transcriptional regulator
MGQARNRQKRKTRHLLMNALAALLEEKPLRQISVSDLVTRADISRTTFYRNYADKDQFVESVKWELLNGIFESVSHDSMSSARDRRIYFRAFFEYIHQNRIFFKTFVNDEKWPQFKDEFVDNGIEAYRRTIGDRTLGGGMPSLMLIHYIVAAHVGVFCYWLSEDCESSVDFMAEQLTRLTLEGPLKTVGLDETTVTLPS